MDNNNNTINNTDTFVNYIKIMHDSKGKHEIEKASKVLSDISNSKEAWAITKSVLENPNHDERTYFHAAKTIMTKVQYDLNELKEEEYEFIFDFLLERLIALTALKKGARSYIEESLIMIYMRLFKRKPEFIEQLLTKLGQQYFPYFLETIELIPAQVNDDAIVIEDELRDLFRIFMHKQLQPQILKILHLSVQASQDSLDDRIKYNLIKSFKVWILDKTDPVIIHDLVQHNIQLLCFEELKNRDLVEEAGSVLEAVQFLANKPEKYENLYQQFHTNIIGSFTLCQDLIIESCSEEVEGIQKVYTKFLLRILPRALKMPTENSVKGILQLIQAAYKEADQSLTDYQVEVITDLFLKLHKIDPELKNDCQNFISIYKEDFFNAIIIESLKILRMTQGHLKFFQNRSIESDDEEDEGFHTKNKDREDVKYLLRTMSKLIGFEDVMQVVAGQIQQTLSYVNGIETPLSVHCDLESQFFAIYAIMKRADIDNASHKQKIKDVLAQILKLNFEYVKILHTCLLIVKKGSGYIDQERDLQLPVFKFLSKCLQIKHLSCSSAEAISYLCENNKQFVVENINDFMQLYDQMSNNDDIVIGIVKATNILHYNSNTADLIRKICSPFASKLLEIQKDQCQDDTNKNELSPRKSNKQSRVMEEQFCENLVKLSTVIRHLNPVKDDQENHVMLELFRELWPLIELMLQRYKDDSRYMEKVCKIVKHTMRCIKHLFVEFLEKYFTIILINYQEYPLPAYLYTVEIALTIFYQDNNKKVWLEHMFGTMVLRTLQELAVLDQFEKNPDLVEDYYGFQFRFLRYALDIFLQSQCLETIQAHTVVGIGITQVEAGKMLYNFILEVFRNSNPKLKTKKGKDDESQSEETRMLEYQSMVEKAEKLRGLLVDKYGKIYVKSMLESLPKNYPVDIVVDEMSTAFLGAIQYFPKECYDWFHEGLKDIPLSVLNIAEKESFMQNLKQKSMDDDKEYYDNFFSKYANRAKKYNMRNDIEQFGQMRIINDFVLSFNNDKQNFRFKLIRHSTVPY